MTGALTNLSARLNDTLQEYKLLSGKSNHEILTKQGGKLYFAIQKRLRDTAPAKGSIRTEILTRLATGRRVKIRPEVRESVGLKSVRTEILKQKGSKKKAVRTFNFGRELIRREIAVRESGRMVLAVSARYPQTLTGLDSAQSRFGDLLSASRVKIGQGESLARLTWRGDTKRARSVDAGIGRNVAAIRMAIADVDRDIAVYTTRKRLELAAKAAKKIFGPMRRASK